MIHALDWQQIRAELNDRGCAIIGPVLTSEQCAELIELYRSPAAFRKRVVMKQHGYGSGEYQYFAYPLPEIVANLRRALYPPLAILANAWQAALGKSPDFPPEHQAFLQRCHEAGQVRPTPLLLRYATGDYNCLHQDLYGAHVFPLQATILLDAAFTGGEFVLTEQRPRMQSRPDVITLQAGQAVIFAVHTRPVIGSRGPYRVLHRHGVSRIRSGQRHTLGIIFHDAA